MHRSDTIIYKLYILALILTTGCRPDMPVTSIITVDADGLTTAVNKELYGLTLEEINHAIDGGLYGELIQNRSFEDGVMPPNTRFDYGRNIIITPNGWITSFPRPDSIVGWKPLSPTSRLSLEPKEPVNDKNRRTLHVSVFASPQTGRGGVAATGYKGIPLRKGERYNLTFYIKGGYNLPRNLHVALEDSSLTHPLSETFSLYPRNEWKKYSHVFTATENTDKALLTFSSDSTFTFWLDVVSLFPENTWKERLNGVRPDLAEAIAELQPRFIRFPGGSFVEGYSAGTYPIWWETIGDIAERRHLWGVWGYGTSNGMGYHEYLQFCKDVGAEPLYVINSGVTSQSRRQRNEDITQMHHLVKDAIDAIAYANQPADSTFGAMRAANGHPEPFNLKYIEIGSENYGYEYARRFRLFKAAISEVYPDVMVISSAPVSQQIRTDWVDQHFYASDNFYISSYNRYELRYNRREPGIFIGEFATSPENVTGTMRAAIGEACFYIGVEKMPEAVKRLAYAPALGNVNYELNKYPFILFNNSQIVKTPSYYLYQMFATHRGDELLKTEVNTYNKPQVTTGWASVWMFDNSFEFRHVTLNNIPVKNGIVERGGWKIEEGRLIPDANRWNYLLIGDSTAYNYEFNLSLQRTKGSGTIQVRVRDNGLSGDQNEHIGVLIGNKTVELYRQIGAMRDTLVTPVDFPFENNHWYNLQIRCKDDQIECLIDDQSLGTVSLPPLPSVVAVATLDEEKQVIFLKVVNTTLHEERTELNIRGVSIKNDIEVIELTGIPTARNTFENPEVIIPRRKEISYPLGVAMNYTFPPNSVTILKLQIN